VLVLEATELPNVASGGIGQRDPGRSWFNDPNSVSVAALHQ
jgi:hypothetical protein